MSHRLLRSLLATSLVLNALYSGLASVVVPALLAEAAPAAKETNLAIVMATSSALTLVVHPLAGSWSDRTRTRWGRRAPWIVGGAVLAATAIVGLGQAAGVLAVAIGWVLVQPLLNVVEAPLDAVLADRVPPEQRSRASAFYGAGGAVGLATGVVLAGALVARPAVACLVLAGALLVVMTGFVVLNPDRSPVRRRDSAPWYRALAVPSFRQVFAGRFLLILGSQLVMTYLLYIVMDATGTGVEEAGGVVAVLVAVNIGCVVVGALAGTRWSAGNRARTVLVATTVVLAGLAIPLVAPNFGGLVAYAVVSGLGRGAYLTADLALMLDVLPTGADHGRDLGLLSLATILPQTMAPAAAGVLLAASGNAYWVLFAAALVAVAASMPLIAKVARSPQFSSIPSASALASASGRDETSSLR